MLNHGQLAQQSDQALGAKQRAGLFQGQHVDIALARRLACLATDMQGCYRDAHELVRQLGNAQQVAAKLFKQVVALAWGNR